MGLGRLPVQSTPFRSCSPRKCRTALYFKDEILSKRQSIDFHRRTRLLSATQFAGSGLAKRVSDDILGGLHSQAAKPPINCELLTESSNFSWPNHQALRRV